MNSLWAILTVAIGISFIFMILSILNSWLQDYFASAFHIRAHNLADIMQVLLEPNATKLNGKAMAVQPPPITADCELEPEKLAKKLKLDKKQKLKDVAVDKNVTVEDLVIANLKFLENLPIREGSEIMLPKCTHKTGKNESLKIIADKYGVAIEAVKSVNDKIFTEPIKEGKQIIHSYNITKTVEPGSTLNQIAANNPFSGESLLELNPNVLSILKSYAESEPEEAQSEAIEKSKSNPGSRINLDMNLQIIQNTKKVFNSDLRYLDTPLPSKVELTFPKLAHEVKKYKTFIDLAAAHNEIDESDLELDSGVEIEIPEASYSTKEAEDTLREIAKNNSRNLEDLLKENIDWFAQVELSQGSTLILPDKEAGRHKVVAKDTLSKIALQYGVSLDKLKKNNPGIEDEPVPGTTVYIPKPEIGQMTDRKNVLKQLQSNPVGSLYRHPIIHSLSKPGQLPDRIPTKDFTVALLDLLDDVGRVEGKKSTDVIDINQIIKGIELLEGGEISGTSHPLAFRLRSLLHTAQINTQIKTKAKEAVETNLEEFTNAVSEWFDDTVARGAVWYKRKMQRIGIIFGILLAVLLNADTLTMSNALWRNAALRETVAQIAEMSVQQNEMLDSDQAAAQLESFAELGLPLGWTFDSEGRDPRAMPMTIGGWVTKAIGLLMTGFAISQGSQLWFDLINRLINIRSTRSGSEPNESIAKAG